MHSPWLAFYRGDEPDSEGRYIHEILCWNDDQLESVHDYIQWLFPLPEPSMFKSNAPLPTDSDIASARADAAIRANLKAAFQRMLRFYGLTPDTAALPKPWVRPADHNHLRLTRILRSLRLLGLGEEAMQLYEAIIVYDNVIPERTRNFWRNAVSDR